MSISARYRLGIATGTALLAGCGGSLSPISGPSASTTAVRQPSPAATASLKGRAHVRPEYKVGGPLVYVTNYTSNNLTVYHAHAKNPDPIAVISHTLAAPSGDCIDSHGTLYVANQPASGTGWIAEYLIGETKAFKTITNGINTPAFCAIDGRGNLWVTNQGGPTVTEYLYGSKKPTFVIKDGLTDPDGIAIDHSGNIYVGNLVPSGSNVQVFAPGSKSPSRTITDGITWPVGMSIDSNGTLYVTNATANNVEEYLLGQSHPDRTITQGLDDPVAVVLNTKGWLYVANFGNSNNVAEFPPGSTSPSHRQISKGVYAPEGVAYFPAPTP